MALTDALLPEFDHEMATTRKLLERVPDAEFAWRPHQKSMTLGQLSFHLAKLPGWLVSIVDRTVLEAETLGDAMVLTEPDSRMTLLDRFDTNVGAARKALTGRTDAEWAVMWTFKAGGEEVFTLPRSSAIRFFILNHIIHHRGQLSVYLRQHNVALPSIYGPTADEQ